MSGTIRKIKRLPQLLHRKRVAAYARVSSGKDAMLHSLSAQVGYYSSMIQQNPGWEYAGVYADEAVTGTKDTREDFCRLLADCRAGKVDVILTKSISRFARNTVTLLETVRELKALGVDVYFEEQNLHSTGTDGELLLTILASYAQEESLSASENQKWRIRKGFENGELLNWRFMFGYRIEKGETEIEPDEAAVVREIFGRAIAGESFGDICDSLNLRGITGALGGRWSTPRLHAILENEKYTGNALLQKRYRNNHLEKKFCLNTGELPKYYAAESHPAIIDDDTFRAAQAVLRHWKARTEKRAMPKRSEFTGVIRCDRCGSVFKHVNNNSTIGWNCRTYLERGKRFCHSKKIPEDTLKTACAEALGLESYDAAAFTEQIEYIAVPEGNRLIFHFRDGCIDERIWKDRSRADSWTPAMREAARKRMLNRKERG